MPNSYEEENNLDPSNKDTDGDGIIDGLELINGTDLLDKNSNTIGADSDGDGIAETVFYQILGIKGWEGCIDDTACIAYGMP